MTVNRALFERVVRDLLVVRGGHLLEVYEGSGSSWQRVRCAPLLPHYMLRRTPWPAKLSLFPDCCTDSQNVESQLKISTCYLRTSPRTGAALRLHHMLRIMDMAQQKGLSQLPWTS